MPSCPSCAEDLPQHAERCHHCGERLCRTLLLSEEDQAQERAEQRAAARARARKLLLFFGGLALLLLGVGSANLVASGLLRGDRVVEILDRPGRSLATVSRTTPGGRQGEFLDKSCEFVFLWDDYTDEPRSVARVVDDAKDPSDDPSPEELKGLDMVRLELRGETLGRIHAPIPSGLGPPTYLGFEPMAPRAGQALRGRTIALSAAEHAWSRSKVGGSIPSAIFVLLGLFSAALAVYVPAVVLVVDRGARQGARDLRAWLAARLRRTPPQHPGAPTEETT